MSELSHGDERGPTHRINFRPVGLCESEYERVWATAAAVRIEDYRDTRRGHRVLHLIGKGNKPATMPLTVPVLQVLEACRGQRTDGPLVLHPEVLQDFSSVEHRELPQSNRWIRGSNALTR